MAARAIIREGDTTSHGGTVLEAFSKLNIYGKFASGVGHRGYCPQCKREFLIVAGAKNFIFMGQNVAVEGMLTSCGAVLIASQSQATVDTEPGAVKMVPGPLSAQVHRSQKIEIEKDDLEYYFVVEREDGSPVNLAYRIDFDGKKLYEGALGQKGRTTAFSMSQAVEPTFWIPFQ